LRLDPSRLASCVPERLALGYPLDTLPPGPLRSRLRVGDPAFFRLEVGLMTWEAPDFIEVKMDAEINSYQDDFEREQDDRF
jgi:hypothetical protein